MDDTFNDNVDRRASGVRLSTVTLDHLFKVWANYRLTGAMLAWSLGAGVMAQDLTSAPDLYRPAITQQVNAKGHGWIVDLSISACGLVCACGVCHQQGLERCHEGWQPV